MKVKPSPTSAPRPRASAVPPDASARHALNRSTVLGQVSDMDLRLLQVFKAVVDCGGMSAAALELNIGTSSLSRHIKDLETRLQMLLCRRGRAGFALTPEGQLIYEQTQQLLAAVNGFRSRVHDIHAERGALGGPLALAVFDKTASNPEARIAQAIAQFGAEAPQVHLHLHVASISDIERGLLDGRWQLGIVPAHRESPSLQHAPLFDETMLLYCAASHPLYTLSASDDRKLTWRDMQAHRFAGLGYHSPNMTLSHQAELSRQATGYDQESIATLVLSGRYLGFLPDHYAAPFVAAGQLRALNPSTLNYHCQFVAVWRNSPSLSRAAQAFLQCLRDAHRGALRL